MKKRSWYSKTHQGVQPRALGHDLTLNSPPVTDGFGPSLKTFEDLFAHIVAGERDFYTNHLVKLQGTNDCCFGAFRTVSPGGYVSGLS